MTEEQALKIAKLLDKSKTGLSEDDLLGLKLINDTGAKAGNLVGGAGLLGNLMSATSDMPGQEPNVKQSAIGGALSGLSSGMAFGPFGALIGAAIGGTTGYASGSKNLEEHLMQMNEEQEMNIASKTIQPTSYAQGGDTTGVGIQTELDEFLLLPETMEIVKSAAKKKHKDMKPNDITDFVPEGTIVFSNRKKFNPNKVKDKVIGYGPGHYEEGNSYSPEKILVGNKFGTKKVTMAEAAKKLSKSIPTVGKKNKDIFDEITDSENKVTRMMFMQELIDAQEGEDTPTFNPEGVQQFADGGKVKKYAYGDEVVGQGVSSKYYADVLKKLRGLRQTNEDEYSSGNRDLKALQKRMRGSILGQAGAETLFTALQNPRVRPVVQDTTFIEEAHKQLPLSFIDSQVSPIRGSVNSTARLLLDSGVDPKDLPAMLAGSQGRALEAEGRMRTNLILDRVNTDRGRGEALRNNLVENKTNLVNAENEEQGNYNQRFRNFGQILANSMGDLREIDAGGVKAGRNLKKSYLDNNISLFQTESDIAGNRMEFDDNMRRINDRLESLKKERHKLNIDIDRRNGAFNNFERIDYTPNAPSSLSSPEIDIFEYLGLPR